MLILDHNIFLNVWCLCCALTGTFYIDKIGRKLTGLISTASLTTCLFAVGALTKVFGTSSNISGIYSTVAAILLFQGAYSFGWTPLLYLHPPEVLNYPIRANGMGIFTFVLNIVALLSVFSIPFAIDTLGWKTYIINGSWDVLEVLFMSYYWVETSGKTLEEIDAMIEGRRHSEGPDLEDASRKVINGKVVDEENERLLEGYGTLTTIMEE